MEEDAGAYIDHLHLAVAVGLDEDVLGLQVAVYDVQSMESGEGSGDLPCDGLQPGKGEVLWLVLVRLEQAVLQEFCEYHEVFSVVEVIMHEKQCTIVGIAVGLDVSQ